MANLKVVDTDVLEADLTSVADKIRAKTGSEEKLAFPSGFESALDTIESADSALAEVEYMMSNGYTDYRNYFYYKQITEIPTEIFRYTSNSTNFQYCFYFCQKVTTFPSFDVSNGIDFQHMFHSCNATTIPLLNTVNGTNFMCMFESCRNTKTIEGVDISKATNITSMFLKCIALENLTFNGVIKITGLDLSPCKNLTHASLMSAINALYDWASEGTTGTFKLILGSTNLAKLTDAEKAIATQKGWTLA